MIRWVAASCLVIFCAACATSEKGPEASSTSGVNNDASTPESPEAYSMKIEAYSDGEAEYSGFYNNFEYKATLLNTSIRDALIKRQSEYYQWDRDKLATEREKSNQEMATETAIFMSFFTPDRKNDNLADIKSIWRIYLDVGGRRYQGKVKKLRTLLAELQALYPYHTRWNTSYLVQFPVPTTAIESQDSKLTVTGPLGTKMVSFHGLK
jgi:hypothetical protein